MTPILPYLAITAKHFRASTKSHSLSAQRDAVDRLLSTKMVTGYGKCWNYVPIQASDDLRTHRLARTGSYRQAHTRLYAQENDTQAELLLLRHF